MPFSFYITWDVTILLINLKKIGKEMNPKNLEREKILSKRKGNESQETFDKGMNPKEIGKGMIYTKNKGHWPLGWHGIMLQMKFT